jgi:hypothetical protein
MSISPHWVSSAPGLFPIRGTSWTVTDMSHQQERMSPIGIILCIFFIWVCFLGLLFLLMKERTVSGYIQVTVQGSGFQHSTLIPAASDQTAWQVNQAVNYARALAAAA